MTAPTPSLIRRKMLESECREVRQLADIVSVFFHNREAHIVGSALAELTSKWLALYDDKRMRERVLKSHLALIEALMPINEKELAKIQKQQSTTH